MATFAGSSWPGSCRQMNRVRTVLLGAINETGAGRAQGWKPGTLPGVRGGDHPGPIDRAGHLRLGMDARMSRLLRENRERQNPSPIPAFPCCWVGAGINHQTFVLGTTS